MAQYETFSKPDFDSLDRVYSKEIVSRIFEDALADQKLIVARYFLGIADKDDDERGELLKIHDSRLQNIIKKNMEGQAQGGSRVPEMLDGEEPKNSEDDEDEEYNDVDGIDSDYDGNHRKYGSF